MIEDVSYVLTLGTLDEREARFTLDREDVPYVSLVLPRSDWTGLQAPTQVRVRVEVSAQLPAEAETKPSVTERPIRSPLTSHGHDIPGVTTAGVLPEGQQVARCGGVRLCRTCRREADFYEVHS